MSPLEDLHRFVAGVGGRSFTAAAEARVRCRAGLTPDDRSFQGVGGGSGPQSVDAEAGLPGVVPNQREVSGLDTYVETPYTAHQQLTLTTGVA